MLTIEGVADQRIGVLGAGRSGLSVARALEASGAAAVCWDDRPSGRAAAAAAGFQGLDPATDASDAASLDLLILSPGAPHLHPAPHPVAAAAAAAGVPLDNDVGLFFRALAAMAPGGRPRVAAVTGSNGKSTTSALLHHILACAGRDAHLGGNIGRGVFDLPAPTDGAAAPLVYVLELSSYQTDVAAQLTPDVAVFTNLSPDHLDRHGGYGGYFAAKRRLFDRPYPGVSVIGVDEPEGRLLAQSLRAGGAEVVRLSVRGAPAGGDAAVYADDGWLRLRAGAGALPEFEIGLSQLKRLPGRHNHQNAGAAAAAAAALGVGAPDIEVGLAGFAGLAHRLQTVASLPRGDGRVVFVNDSKATNAEAAEKALEAFSRVRWIAGGQAKDGGIDRLRPLFGRVAKAYLIGDAAAAFQSTIGTAAPSERYDELAAAVTAAAREAETGDVVLLSPAAASFDQFSDFEARGAAFEAAVAAVPGVVDETCR